MKYIGWLLFGIIVGWFGGVYMQLTGRFDLGPVLGLEKEARKQGYEVGEDAVEGFREAVKDAFPGLVKEPIPAREPPIAEDHLGPSNIIEVQLRNKRFQERNRRQRIAQDAIWWDATYTGVGLDKATRAVKGVLSLCDLFEESHFLIRATITQPIEPRGSVTVNGTGFEYNKFMSSHHWVLSTDLSDMAFKFHVTDILYADGTKVNFIK